MRWVTVAVFDEKDLRFLKLCRQENLICDSQYEDLRFDYGSFYDVSQLIADWQAKANLD